MVYNSLGFWNTNMSPNPARRSDLVLVDKKKTICQLTDFVIPIDHRLKIKKNKK